MDLVTSAHGCLFGPDFANSPPRVVVWEMPERFMDAPLNRVALTWSRELAASGD